MDLPGRVAWSGLVFPTPVDRCARAAWPPHDLQPPRARLAPRAAEPSTLGSASLPSAAVAHRATTAPRYVGGMAWTRRVRRARRSAALDMARGGVRPPRPARRCVSHLSLAGNHDGAGDLRRCSHLHVSSPGSRTLLRESATVPSRERLMVGNACACRMFRANSSRLRSRQAVRNDGDGCACARSRVAWCTPAVRAQCPATDTPRRHRMPPRAVSTPARRRRGGKRDAIRLYCTSSLFTISPGAVQSHGLRVCYNEQEIVRSVTEKNTDDRKRERESRRKGYINHDAQRRTLVRACGSEVPRCRGHVEKVGESLDIIDRIERL